MIIEYKCESCGRTEKGEISFHLSGFYIECPQPGCDSKEPMKANFKNQGQTELLTEKGRI